MKSAAVHSPIQVAKETHGDAAEVMFHHTHTPSLTDGKLAKCVCFVVIVIDGLVLCDKVDGKAQFCSASWKARVITEQQDM